ncbi:hypothetical protein HIO71_06390 [Chryseobacterium aquaticum]|uniref:Uncharacterized protein n=1 Tax=Chryseobacterium aquaticum TaxID=452084 RepID=A0A848MYT4_9FLAO|nr:MULTISPECIES: hypothetical protein [Chryseobacterium]NMR33837.1 hypothetical protein [Chryseobacterium aquaticum]NRQ45913.1 hypothetical protein [Chryseobacterium sp. C-204]
MNKFFLSLLFSLISLLAYSQEYKLDYISLENSNAIVIGSGIKIEIFKSIHDPTRNKHTDISVTRYSIKEKKEIIQKYTLSEVAYDEIVNCILNIKAIDLINNFEIFLDADDTTLKFSSRNALVEYSISGLGKGDKNTPYKDFLFTIQTILNYANVKIRGIND